jgi:hypothetical protein
MWTHRMALISTAMWIWPGMVKMRQMKRRKMRRRKMKRRRRWWMRMRMMAKNLGQLARERW